MRLATNLIEIGLPYIASFLPSANKDFWSKDQRDPWPSTIPLNPNPTEKEIRDAAKDLKILARDLTWYANDVMYPKWGQLGVTRLADSEEPWDHLDFDEVLVSDERLKSQKKQRRPLFIGIMKEYVTAIEKSELDSESNIRATFMFAITMVHEIGHAIFHNDLRAFNRTREPYIGDGCEAEIGFSFIAWIFSGFHPQPTPHDVQFTNTMYWEPQYTLSMGTRPLYKTYYSIPIAYLERVLSQDFWDSLGSRDQPGFSDRARVALRPDTNDRSQYVATAKQPNWKWSHLHDRPVWIEHNHFRMKNFRERDRIKGLTKEEIQFEYDLTKDDPINVKYQKMTKGERRRLYQNMRMNNKGSDSPNQDDSESVLEDSDSDFQPGKSSEPTTSKRTQAMPIPKITVTRDDEDEYDMGPPVERTGGRKRTILEMRNQLFIRGAEINGLVTGPSTGGRKWPRLGSNIMDDIDDYEAVMDLTKKEEEEKKGMGQGVPRVVRKRRDRKARPQTPPSHMKDIYDLIVIDDDNDDDADDEESGWNGKY